MKKIFCQPVFLAILFAAATVCVASSYPSLFAVKFFFVIDLASIGFLRLLTALVVPLVCSSIISSVARLGAESSLGKMGGKTAIFYLGSTVVALLIGIVLVNLVEPGKAYNIQLLSLQSAPSLQVWDTKSLLESWIPSNIFQALAEGKMLPLIGLSLVLGAAIARLQEQYQEPLIMFFEAVFQMMLEVSSMVFKVLPLGIYALTVKAFMGLGKATLGPLFLFSATVLLGLFVFMFVVIPLFLRFYAKVDPFLYLKAISPALVTAFTTSSSAAAIPITISCIEKRVGVSKKISHLIVPLGISINLSGSALYECVAALFVAQAYGLDLGIGTQFCVMFLALFTSMGVAGIPAGSLVATIIIMQFLGLPAEGVGLFIAVERLMDMARTTVNIYSDGACAVLVAASEGETDFFPKADSTVSNT